MLNESCNDFGCLLRLALEDQVRTSDARDLDPRLDCAHFCEGELANQSVLQGLNVKDGHRNLTECEPCIDLQNLMEACCKNGWLD